MDRAYLPRIRSGVVSAVGVAILLSTPLLAQADQGKWWKPKEGDQRVERRDRGRQGAREQQDRGNRGGGWDGRRDGGNGGTWRDRTSGDRGSWRGSDRGRTGSGWSGGITYRDRRYSGSGSWGGYSTWRGYPVRRDILVIRDQRYGGYFRARRLYCAPRFYGGFAYVRPVRFFIGADACIGGVGIHARIMRPHYPYGCNFCDERFGTYEAYAAHVANCPYRPGDCRVSVSNWDDGYDSQWNGPYQTDDQYYEYDNNNDDYQGGSEDDGYYDN